MDFLLEALTNWLKEMLVGGIMSNLSGMFDSVNQQVADISVQVGQTPQGWNSSIFNMIENLSNSIMVPIAGVILAIVMTVDLIQMIADKNNLHDVDTWMIFKWVFKSAAAILIVTNTWNIVMGVFDMAQSVVAQAAGIIGSDASINDRANRLAYADDSSYYLLCALEVIDEDGKLERKADMFTKRTIKPHQAVAVVDTASEALAVSISEKACVDMDYMSQLTGKTKEALAGELQGVIFSVPGQLEQDGTPHYVTADEIGRAHV